MFYGKRIAELENELTALEEKVKGLVHRVDEQGEQIDAIVEVLKKQEAARKAKQCKRFKPKKDGKEIPAKDAE